MPRPEPRSAFFAALIAASVFSFPAVAQDAPDPSKLKSLERELEQTQAERERLEKQASASARALMAVREDMIATAKEIQEQEHSLTVLENRIAEMERDSARLTKTLGRRDTQMVQVLMAIERLALRPSDALTLNPLSPADAVRSAILLRAALPNIRQSSADLQGELKDLYRLRAEIVERKEQAAAGAAALVQKHRRLDALAKEKAGAYETLLARGEDATQRMARMGREAEDLRALFAKLAEEKAKREAAEKKLAAERAQQEKEQREKEQKLAAERAAEAKAKAEAEAKAGGRIVLKPPPGVAPHQPGAEKQTASLPPAKKSDEETVTRSFAKARGTMPFPVTGKLASKYGEASQAAGEAGLMAKGITIQSRSGAQVVAPFDGIVAFAGPFRGYGLLLIIEHSEGYHTLLAGMGHIDAAVGQRVLAGEPVGIMESDGAPALYVELRRDGQPINPLPWLADRAGKNSG
ncbi:MAG: peptidoglycan DD-metalloendopeptidase family protein [Rhodospirillaceae bacterium]|nr:peptidoglycan DD-metalloendopeptidase family protein [Rhodospirillaceae bacterium]